MEHYFNRIISFLFVFLMILGGCLVLFYSAIPFEFKNYIIEKNQFLLLNATDTINLLSKNPDKSKFIFICSFYFEWLFTFSYLIIAIALGNLRVFSVTVNMPFYKTALFLVFAYIFFSSFYIFCLIFPGSDPRMDRLFWTGGLVSNMAIVFFMVLHGLMNTLIFTFFHLIGKLIRDKYYGR